MMSLLKYNKKDRDLTKLLSPTVKSLRKSLILDKITLKGTKGT